MAVILLTGSGKTADINEIFFKGKSWLWSEANHAFVTKVPVKGMFDLKYYTLHEQSLGTLDKEDRLLIMGLIKFAVEQEYPGHKTVMYPLPVHPMSKSSLAFEHLGQKVKGAFDDMHGFQKILVKAVMLPQKLLKVK